AATNPNRATMDFSDWDSDKMHRTDKWVESSISDSSGVGSTTSSQDSPPGDYGGYILDPPPPARRRSISVHGRRERDREYHSSNHHPLLRSLREPHRYSTYHAGAGRPMIEYDYAIAPRDGGAGGRPKHRTSYHG